MVTGPTDGQLQAACRRLLQQEVVVGSSIGGPSLKSLLQRPAPSEPPARSAAASTSSGRSASGSRSASAWLMLLEHGAYLMDRALQPHPLAHIPLPASSHVAQTLLEGQLISEDEVQVFSHSTHSSHMSHPILPIYSPGILFQDGNTPLPHHGRPGDWWASLARGAAQGAADARPTPPPRWTLPCRALTGGTIPHWAQAGPWRVVADGADDADADDAADADGGLPDRDDDGGRGCLDSSGCRISGCRIACIPAEAPLTLRGWTGGKQIQERFLGPPFVTESNVSSLFSSVFAPSAVEALTLQGRMRGSKSQQVSHMTAHAFSPICHDGPIRPMKRTL